MSAMIGMEVIVEIDENERYWVGKGFGKGGLLPTDRGAFSSTDGSISWKPKEDASEDLQILGRGWQYYKSGDEFAAEGCWLYASDFKPESLALAKPQRGAMHWIRFRRLVRTKVFIPDEFISRQVYEKCDHCDSAATASISQYILDVLTYASLLHAPAHAKLSILLPLKTKVIDLIIKQDIHSPEGDVDAEQELNRLRKDLENFTEVERKVASSSMSHFFNGIGYSFYSRNDHKDFLTRRDIVSAECLPKCERDTIAGLIVRKLDPNFQLHCDKIDCGKECQFARVPCPYPGCSETMSKVLLESHQSKCSYRVVTCTCGETLPECELQNHQSQLCLLRTVECPFKDVGCESHTKAGDLEEHLSKSSNNHLSLTLARLLEQQNVIRDMYSRLSALEVENKNLKQSLQDQSKDSNKQIGDLTTKLNKTEKELKRVEAKYTKELKMLKKTTQQIK